MQIRLPISPQCRAYKHRAIVGHIMNTNSTVHTALRWTALGALFLIPFTPLVVTTSYFFPFITGKAFYFRILAEIVFVAWAVLALMDRAYRPRFSWVGAVVVAFVAWMGFADALAINATKAFWSNFERMEGWVLLIHLLGFFVASSAVLGVTKKWRAWFLTSLGASLLIACYALLQLGGSAAIHQGSTRIDASLGNSAYLAVYLLFSVFVAMWLAITEERAWLKYVLYAVALLDGVLLLFTETRGTVIGLTVGLAIASGLTILTGSQKARRYAGGGLAVLVLLVGVLYFARNTSFVQENHVLQRITSVSVADGHVRFMIWGAAWQGVKERPILGWGQEGFNYAFNKYYNPGLYTQEQWFDRAHNAFLDWLTAGGFPAFLLYVGLFAIAIVMLWRNSELSRGERISLTGLLVAYGIHNIFVFDNIYSYVYFFAILAVIHSQIARPFARVEETPELTSDDTVTYALPIGAIVLVVLIWWVNGVNMAAASNLITALSGFPDSTPAQADQEINRRLDIFESFARNPIFAMQEVREQLVQFAMLVVQRPDISNEVKARAVNLAATEMQKQTDHYPLDARNHAFLVIFYRAIGDNQKALTEINTAINLSPGKEEFYVQRALIQWMLGDLEGAKESFLKAYELGPQFETLAVNAAAGYLAVGDEKSAHDLLKKAGVSQNVDEDVIGNAYIMSKNWPKLIEFWQTRIEQHPTVEAWVWLARAYYVSGDRGSAIATLRKAATLYPSAAGEINAAILQVQGK